MRSIVIDIIVAVILFGVLQSCASGGNREYADFVNIPADGWAYGDTVTFCIEPDSVVSAGTLRLAVRHSSAYKYSNLWLELTLPSGDSTIIDTINVVLTDKYGHMLGRGTGVSFVKTDTVAKDFLPEPNRPIALRHIMRVDTVRDIEQIGIVWNAHE